jgi:hypothetical protein
MILPVPVVRAPRRKLSDEIDRLNQILGRAVPAFGAERGFIL